MSEFSLIMADEVQNDVNEQVADIAPFDPTKKKKKKKVVLQDPADESVDKLAEKTESLAVSEGLETTTFSGLKKKKKPVEASSLNDDGVDGTEDLDDQAGENEEREGVVLQYRFPWEGSDRDYEYEELLGRVFNILRENNPELAGDRRRTVMRPPQVLREGTKKTVFVNFMDLCKTIDVGWLKLVDPIFERLYFFSYNLMKSLFLASKQNMLVDPYNWGSLLGLSNAMTSVRLEYKTSWQDASAARPCHGFLIG
ncbi:eukaryotic translation initiation factor 2 subunit beta-like isoform X4 [Momordica charantia]|uniref:Eukaryotic translation initiation factor 2 subunit beta-like isoform X4 n=1 Tax=Momordica charantia TaxID=3673 RepID=A0A6J1DWP1_MOMCH|nr:eukaryotic translation initiation factor 2 subunit beta-like isoform X4 [Momordica charantia]